MSNDVSSQQTTNIVPVQGIFQPAPTYSLVTLIGPAGTPFYASINPNQSGLSITNSTINSSSIGLYSPSTAAFTSATVSATPTGSNDVVNKAYVDFVAAGLTWKQAVRVASTANITTLSGLLTIDTITVTEGERVLVKNQGTAANNGIYNASAGPWTRALDANSWDEYVGAITFVESGSQAGSAWYSSAQPGGTLGVTDINWSNFSVASTYTAGTGLTLLANQFSITNTGVTATNYGSASSVATFTVNAQGQLTTASSTSIGIAANQVTSGTFTVAQGGTGADTFTAGYLKANGTTAFSTVSNIPNTDISGLGTMSTQNATSVAITGGSGAFGTLKTLGLTGYLKGNDTSAVTASATIPSSDVSGLGSMATQNANSVSITGGTVTGITNLGADYLQLNVAATVTPAVGKLWWNGGTTLNIGMTANVTGEVNETQFVYIKASAAITKGNVVAQDGSVGASGILKAKPAPLATNDSHVIIGVAAEDIALNGFGLIQISGYIKGINTTGSSVGEVWADEDQLYYNPAYVGGLTNVLPSAPNIKLPLAEVVHASSGGSGSLFIKIGSSSTLGGTDSNVQITGTPSDGSLLQYYTTGGYWRNVASSTVAVGTATNLAGGAAASIPYQSAAGATAFLASAAGDSGKVLQSNGTSAPTWATPTAYATVTDDTTTNATRYPLFAAVTSGNLTTEYVSSTKLQFNPSTGALTASQLIIAP